MIPPKMATPGLVKVKVFLNKGYNVIIFVYDTINKILSRDSIYVVNVVMWPKFGNSSVSMREVVITLYGFDQKNHFFVGWPWFRFNSLGLALVLLLKFYTSVTKGLKVKVRKFLNLLPMFVEVTWKKLVAEGGGRRGFLPPPPSPE